MSPPRCSVPHWYEKLVNHLWYLNDDIKHKLIYLLVMKPHVKYEHLFQKEKLAIDLIISPRFVCKNSQIVNYESC